MKVRVLLIAVMASTSMGLANGDAFDCAWRSVAEEFAHHIMPALTPIQIQTIRSSLFPPSCTPPPSNDLYTPQQNRAQMRTDRKILGESFVISPDPSVKPCSDAFDGTLERPFCSIQRGVEACRGILSGCTVYLLDGQPHRLMHTVEITGENVGLSITSYPGQYATVVGTKAVGKEEGWELVFETEEANVYRIELEDSVEEVRSLYVNGVRGVRARYPNCYPEYDTKACWQKSDNSQWLDIPDLGDPIQINPNITRQDFDSWFPNYTAGVGGQCSRFNPPVSYWCSHHSQWGDIGMYMLPGGLIYGSQLPHAPYANSTGAILSAWHPDRWANWMFTVKSDNGTAFTSWEKGGFQGGRGAAFGSDWSIQNVFEEIDYPMEFYFDRHSHELYYAVNKSSGPPPKNMERAVLKTLFRVVGSPTRPVSNVTLKDFKITGTAYTFMDDHGSPSGGDWALQRSGAIFLENSADFLISGCHLTRIDGNAIMISGKNRNVRILNNEISWIGDTAVASWGYTEGYHPAQPAGTGPDARGQEYPIGTVLEGNLIHHVGSDEKQSACYFQAKTGRARLSRNICFESPRAGFLINDGMAGGDIIEKNLLFNLVKETGDHGPINSWDRVAWLMKDSDGRDTTVPEIIEISGNFLHASGGGGCVDNDDGSSYYDIHSNVCIYGGFKSSNMGGHSKRFDDNLVLYSEVYGPTCVWLYPGSLEGFKGPHWPMPGLEETYSNNTCVLREGGMYLTYPSDCTWGDPSTIRAKNANNRIISPTGTARVHGCGEELSFDDWQKLGLDSGSILEKRDLSVADAKKMIREKLRL